MRLLPCRYPTLRRQCLQLFTFFRRQLHPIPLASHPELSLFIGTPENTHHTLLTYQFNGGGLLGIHPWNHAFLRRWCSDHNLQVGTSQVNDLLDISGGWPHILEHHARSHINNWRDRGKATRDYIAKNQTELLKLLGLEQQSRDEILALHDYKAFTPDQARATGDEMVKEEGARFNSEALVRRLWWAKQLGLVQDVRGSWSLNSLVQEITSITSP